MDGDKQTKTVGLHSPVVFIQTVREEGFAEEV